jgi:hypothetical protein
MRAIWKQAWKATVVPAMFLSSAALGQMKGAWVDPPADLLALKAQPAEPSPLVEARPQERTSWEPAIAAPSSETEPGSSPGAVQPRSRDRTERSSLKHSGPQEQTAPFQAVPRWQNAQPAVKSAAAPTIRSRAAARTNPVRSAPGTRQQVAQSLAVDYLNRWSTSNRQALQTTPKFYGSSVLFHGRRMSFGELFAEKRRFVQRWPDRDYRYRPDTLNVRCSPGANTCTVRSAFDFDAVNSKLDRRSRGIGTHELVVSFAGERPVIIAESSRVLSRKSRP